MFADRYRIELTLGSGGTGVVYRAEDRILGHEVALKILRSGASERELGRFRREVAVAQRLNHPGVVRVYDIGRCGDRDYFTMELVEGCSLGDLLRDQGSLTVEEARRLFLDLVDAMGYLHSMGIIHRDIKPANILIEGGDGRFRLGDFSLARLARAGEGTRTQVVGTPHYMAPELVKGAQPDERSDLYSLGATLYEAVTGRTTHGGSSGVEIASCKARKPAVPVRRLRPEVPGELTHVIDGCLERRPSLRFQSTAEMLQTYQTFAASGAFHPPMSRLRRHLRRRWAWWAAALVAVALTGFGVGLRASNRAVRVRIEGARAVGVNRWGGEAWSVAGSGGELSVGRWRLGSNQESLFHVMEKDLQPLSDLVVRRVLMTTDGELVLDTDAMQPLLPVLFDPRSEFSGTLAADLMGWPEGAKPADGSLIPIRVVNYPWYSTCFAVIRSGGLIRVPFSNSGRVHAVAAAAGAPPMVALAVGNNEILHMTAVALFPLSNISGWSPPRMVDLSDRKTGLISYTFVPLNEVELHLSSIRPRADGGWEISTRSGETEILDRDGNRLASLPLAPGADPAEMRRRRMDFLTSLSRIDASRRGGALAVAERLFRELVEEPSVDPLERAALFWIGAKVAAANGDLVLVRERTSACAELWDQTADSDLLRAEAEILGGNYDRALRDLDLAQTKRGSTADDVRLLQLACAWLSGQHSVATRVAESVAYQFEKARARAFLRIMEGDPEEALRLLDPWVDHFVNERIQLLRALALIDLGRVDEARQALRTEIARHGWLREEADWIAMTADVADQQAPPPELVMNMLGRAERRARTDLAVRMLLPRLRLDAARALVAAGDRPAAEPILRRLNADLPMSTLAAWARKLLAGGQSPAGAQASAP